MEKLPEKTSENFKYTEKQWNFCEQIVLCDTKLEAYRNAYPGTNMGMSTMAVKISKLMKMDKIRIRINELRNELAERNRVTIDELVTNLAEMIRFDPIDLYDEDGKLKRIQNMPRVARQMITSIDSMEEFVNIGGESIHVGTTKKVKFYNKLDAIEKLMRHLGAYEKDKNPPAQNNIMIVQLPDNGRGA